MAPGSTSPSKNTKAAAKVRAAQQQKRQRVQWSIGIAVLVIVGVVVLVLAKQSTRSSADDATESAKPAPAALVEDLANVPIGAITEASQAARKTKPGSETNFNPVTAVSASARSQYGTLRSGGKPEVLYMGAEYCPHCANVRWPLVVALSKFGRFSGLKTITSSEGGVPTLSFLGSTYVSDYVGFTPVELEDQDSKPLEKGTDAQMRLLTGLGDSSYPFVDFGGLHIQSGDAFASSPFTGRSHADIAADLAESSGTVDLSTMRGRVDAVAGDFVDAICDITHDRPAKVCKAHR